ncbi:DEAD/DEAH box helicase [Aedoeadaptatus coli]|uniref:DEAD/DEAH box helicase n=1 Tax=Aedoeadaptatus coli TaxID=2058292 RepID=UPI000D54FC9B|nr:DEAD/DEAH box helicase [Peptoniphilus coli]
MKLHDYQKYCVERILDTDNLGLFLDMGLGKTLITLTAIKELIYNRFSVGKVLVIAPKKVAEATWQNEIEKWPELGLLRTSTVLGTEKQRVKALNTPADIYIINRDNVVWLVELYQNAWPFDMVVCDEFSSFKNHQAKRFKALASIKPHIKRLVGLTGTPSPNGLLDLWAQVYLLDGGKRLSPSFYSFRNSYFEGDYMGYNYKARDFSREEITRKISDICISMKADDYLELPECTDNIIPVVLSPKAEKAYLQMEREAVLELEDAEDIDATSAAALSTKLLQLANGAVYDEDKKYHEIHDCKIEAFMETLEQLQGKNVLVFYNFKHDLARLTQALEKKKINFRKLETKEDQKDWNEGKINVLLTHPASSAYGLNLQEGGNHVIWFGLTWNYELYTQANKRLHRQGQKEKVIIHHLVTEDTRDEDVMAALEKKEDVQNYVLESLKARIQRVRAEIGG